MNGQYLRTCHRLSGNPLFSLVKYLEPGERICTNKLESSRTFYTSTGYKVKPSLKPIQNQIVDALRLGERNRASNLLLELSNGSHKFSARSFKKILQYCVELPDPLFVMETWKVMDEKQIGLDNISYLLIMQTLCKGGCLKEARNFLNFIGERHGIHCGLHLYNCFLSACSNMGDVNHASWCIDMMEQKLLGKNEATYTELLKLAVLQQNLHAVHRIWEDYVRHYTPTILPLQNFVSSFARLRDLKSATETLQHLVALASLGKVSLEECNDQRSGCYKKNAYRRQFCSRLDIPLGRYKKSAYGRCFPSRLDTPLGRYKKNAYRELFSSRLNIPLNRYKRNACGRGYFSRLDIPILLNGEVGLQKFYWRENVKCPHLSALTHSSSVKHVDGTNTESKEVKGCITEPSLVILKHSFNDVINACAQAKNFNLAEQLLQQMLKLGVHPSHNTYYGFIRAVVHGKGFREGLAVLKVMQQRNLKPHDKILLTLSVACSKELELDLAEALLDQISGCSSALPFNFFLAVCDKTDQPERAVRMLAKMRRLKVQPDSKTYEWLFSLFGNVNAPYEDGNMLSQADSAKRIRSIELDMEKNNVQHSHLSMKILLKALGREGMIKDLIRHLNIAEGLFYRNNSYLGIPIYNTVLHALVEAKESQLAIDLFRRVTASGIELDLRTYNIMIDCCSVTRSCKSAFALLASLLQNGFYPQTSTYTALIKVLLKVENFDEALNLLDRLLLEDVQVDVLLYNTILSNAFYKGRIDLIELVVEQMQRKKVQPDPRTCSSVFNAYVEHDFHYTAIEALQVLSMRMISLDDSILLERKKELEEFIYSEDGEFESRTIEIFRSSEAFVAVALLNLRWCAILGFPISWSPNQTLWARRLSANYDSGKRNSS